MGSALLAAKERSGRERAALQGVLKAAGEELASVRAEAQSDAAYARKGSLTLD